MVERSQIRGLIMQLISSGEIKTEVKDYDKKGE